MGRGGGPVKSPWPPAVSAHLAALKDQGEGHDQGHGNAGSRVKGRAKAAARAGAGAKAGGAKPKPQRREIHRSTARMCIMSRERRGCGEERTT